jgi:NADPH-dependent 2,4-dienoyl-CoA reductase/sulfur reductase-like enzyme
LVAGAPQAERDAIARRFWEVGRLTLEPWITPRLGPQVHPRPHTEVTQVRRSGEDLRVQLSDGENVTVDFITFATGYRADLGSVPYLGGVLDDVAVTDGFPVLDDAFGTTVPALYLTGFAATRDFGPFFGFLRGAATAATLIVDDLLARRGDRRGSV